VSDPERMMRFGYLLSEIEVGAERLRLGLEEDVMAAVVRLCLHAVELRGIAFEVSNEALDKVTAKLPCEKHPEREAVAKIGLPGPGSRWACAECFEEFDRTVIRLKHPPPEDTEIEDVLPNA
jgi:hypothetical protein